MGFGTHFPDEEYANFKAMAVTKIDLGFIAIRVPLKCLLMATSLDFSNFCHSDRIKYHAEKLLYYMLITRLQFYNESGTDI